MDSLLSLIFGTSSCHSLIFFFFILLRLFSYGFQVHRLVLRSRRKISLRREKFSGNRTPSPSLERAGLNLSTTNSLKLFSSLTETGKRLKLSSGRRLLYRLAYLHEDVEPKVLHRSLISRNILLDDQWNPKMADFGVANLFSPEFCHIIMESLGYEAPEYGSTSSAFTEKNEVYIFGILVMEIISG